ncbi:MAG: HAD family hydrolase [Crocinitomicaceae bacterium]
MAIKNIVLDFGGVLIDIDYHATIDAFKELGIENFEALYSQAQQQDLFNKFETGKISSQYFINQLLDKIGRGISPNQVVKAWNAMLGDIHRENIKAVERIKANGYNVYLLSNTNDIHIQVAFERWKKLPVIEAYDLFDHVFLSQEVGLRKPDEEIFQLVLNELSANPQEVLFVDDSIQHIETANRMGIHTHLLEDINSLSNFLLTKFD